MKLELKALEYSRSLDTVGQPVDAFAPFDMVWLYGVSGLPEGYGAQIRNLDLPRDLWSIQRFRNGVAYGVPTGNYISAEDALIVLQEEYPSKSEPGKL